VGFLLLPDRRRRGLAVEAVSALIPLLFARPAVPALTADVDQRIAACLALLARLGFRETARGARTLR
jgi:[ribosomal protein S5]-alanine N-acetyltransferase